MAGIVLVVMFAFVVLLVGSAVLLVVVLVRRGRAAEAGEVALAVRRHESLVSLGAGLASTAVVLTIVCWPGIEWTSEFEPLPAYRGSLLYASPLVGAVVLCLVRAVGEQLWPRPRGTVRRAALRRRTVRDLGGRRLVTLVVTVCAGAVAIVAYGQTAALGGRSFEHPPVLDDAGTVVARSWSGPYPGWPDGGPVLVGMVVALAATLVVLRVITRRPPLAVLPPEHDDAVRRTSAARVVAGVQLWAGGAVGLLMVVASVPLASASHAVAAVLSAGVGVLVWTVSVLLAATAVRARRPGAPVPARDGGAPRADHPATVPA